jgi:hypothetical protein
MTIIQYVRKFNSFATQGHSYFVPILSKTQTIKHVNVLNIHVLLLQLSDFFIFLPASHFSAQKFEDAHLRIKKEVSTVPLDHNVGQIDGRLTPPRR